MGIGGISAGQLILILVIVVVVFGTKKLQTLGEDLGKGLKGFRKGLRESKEDLIKSDKSDSGNY